MSDWNPELYLKFEKERTQPVIDLISRIEKEKPERIIDIGCGPGNSTRELAKRWTKADIIGLDNSPNMIEKAQSESPEMKWINADAGVDLSHLGKFDIVFSNATIQWIPNHFELINNLFSLLNSDGVLAVQVPNVSNMPINIALKSIIKADKWQDYFIDFSEGLYYDTLNFYYDILCTHTNDITLWETHYYHIMSNHENIIEWYKSSGMRPYLDKLPSDEIRSEFLSDVLNMIRNSYSVQKDGLVLFPFIRQFFIANKK